MKNIKTILLVIILLILVVLNFLPEKSVSENSDDEEIILKNHSITSLDLSDSNQKYVLEKTGGVYNLSLLYVVLYDDASSSLIEAYKSSYEKRLQRFDEFIETESRGRMVSDSRLTFLNVEDVGSSSLSYDKSVFEWMRLFDNKYPQDYNVLSFAPIYGMPWCQDGPSQGFNHKGRIYFCLEAFFNPNIPVENQGAVGLMTHKFLHGVGYNHHNQVHKQYALIDWHMGLPDTNILLHGDFREFDHLFFSQDILRALDLVEPLEFEDRCLDSKGLVCYSQNKFLCKDSIGPFCQDIDQDGIVDSDDKYVFSSPSYLNDTDSDGDGIVDSLDLCDWNNVNLRINGGSAGPMKIVASAGKSHIHFSSESLDIKSIEIIPYQMIGGFIKFEEDKSNVFSEESITLTDSNDLWRLKLFYNYKGKDYFRPYYLYFSGFDADFLYEKEWYYFGRFGCDVPADINFSVLSSYDNDIDGLPDPDKFAWAKNITEDYDWDDDGFSDINDTLPTVHGVCQNKFVKGVKDSDSDGFCDPGRFDFSQSKNLESFEMRMIANYNEFSDLCPYFSGRDNGCPEKIS